MKEGQPGEFHLSQRADLGKGRVAFDTFGAGPPVVLVHGTPTRSYLWRRVAPVLREHFTVYVYDLLGYGESVPHVAGDVSLPTQSAALAELLDHWGIVGAGAAGHDIGAAVVLGAHLLQSKPFARVGLLDGVVLRPWITPTTRHMQAHLETYRSMPGHMYREIVRTHLRSATESAMDPRAFEVFMEQWTSAEGQAAYLQKVALFDEGHTEEIEARLAELRVPVLILWGEKDRWLSPELAARLGEEIPGSRVTTVRNAGHFVMEDAPHEVARALDDFFLGGEPDGGRC
ncbi:alpha/beta hydrolase [soil metagenome]